MKLSPRLRRLAASGPLFASVGLALRQAHVFGAGDLADALFGGFIGLGIGVSFGALALRKRCP
jgi:hypothetical protein